MQKIALAALAVALLSAGAASAQDHRIVVRDLDLGSVEGAAALDARVDEAAGRACTRRELTANANCRRGFRSEVMRQLGPVRRDDYARARSSRVLAMVPVFQG